MLRAWVGRVWEAQQLLRLALNMRARRAAALIRAALGAWAHAAAAAVSSRQGAGLCRERLLLLLLRRSLSCWRDHVALRSRLAAKAQLLSSRRRAALQSTCLLAWAASDRPATTTQWRALLPMAQSWPRPIFPLTGEEVMAAGVPRGPLVGEVMREVEAWWIDNDFISDKLSIVERLKAVAQGMAY